MILILSIGLLGKSLVMVWASVVLILLKFISMEPIIDFMDLKGMKLGLFFLLMSVLAPLARGKINLLEAIDSYKSVAGFLALISGLMAAKVNGMGLNLLDQQPELIIGIVFGSIFGIIFLNGIPIGPLTAGGLMAVFYRFYQFLLS